MREEIKAYRDDNTLNSNIRCIEINYYNNS